MILWMKAFNILKVKMIKIAMDDRTIKSSKFELEKEHLPFSLTL